MSPRSATIREVAKGVIGGYVYRLDRGGPILAVVFKCKEAYVGNAEDPAQDQWYQTFRALLARDPE